MFRENRLSESHTLHKDVNGFIRTVHIYCPDRHVELLNICSSRANQRRECHNFFTGVNNNTCAVDPYSVNKERLCKERVLRHGTHHSKSYSAQRM